MIIVRDAERLDIPAIVLFQQRMARETEDIELDGDVVTRGVTALFEDPARGQYLLAVIDGDPAGCLMLTPEWSDWRAGTVLWIQSVWVESRYRGRGVYRALYDHVKRRATADESIRGIRLYVDQRNERAQAVYRALGMDGEHYRVFEWMKD